MLMGITRIGSLIINENAFNLLFIIAWAVRTLSPAGGKGGRRGYASMQRAEVNRQGEPAKV